MVNLIGKRFSSVLLKPWVRAFRMLSSLHRPASQIVESILSRSFLLSSGFRARKVDGRYIDRGSTTPPASPTDCAASTLSQRTRMRPVAQQFQKYAFEPVSFDCL